MTTDNLSLEERIQQATDEAHAVTEKYGADSKEAAVAWDTLEELHAEAGHQRTKNADKTAFTEYCEEFPDAPEARMYDT
ncbi:MAG: Calvin cycle protein CP12 [Leptolyngbyaceae bacterium]|nr:Calvin cycle protein CP12 [Leptolyngbyaceae bacterium]